MSPRRHAVRTAGLRLSTVIPLYAWRAGCRRRIRSAAAIAMTDMHMNRMGVSWAFPVLQATGIAALLRAYPGIALGLTESGRRVRWPPLNRRQLDNLLTALVPQRERWAARWSYDLGIVAFYLALLLGPTYYLRRRLGPRTWRRVFRLARTDSPHDRRQPLIAGDLRALVHTLVEGSLLAGRQVHRNRFLAARKGQVHDRSDGDNAHVDGEPQPETRTQE